MSEEDRTYRIQIEFRADRLLDISEVGALARDVVAQIEEPSEDSFGPLGPFKTDAIVLRAWTGEDEIAGLRPANPSQLYVVLVERFATHREDAPLVDTDYIVTTDGLDADIMWDYWNRPDAWNPTERVILSHRTVMVPEWAYAYVNDDLLFPPVDWDTWLPAHIWNEANTVSERRKVWLAPPQN